MAYYAGAWRCSRAQHLLPAPQDRGDAALRALYAGQRRGGGAHGGADHEERAQWERSKSRSSRAGAAAARAFVAVPVDDAAPAALADRHGGSMVLARFRLLRHDDLQPARSQTTESPFDTDHEYALYAAHLRDSRAAGLYHRGADHRPPGAQVDTGDGLLHDDAGLWADCLSARPLRLDAALPAGLWGELLFHGVRPQRDDLCLPGGDLPGDGTYNGTRYRGGAG